MKKIITLGLAMVMAFCFADTVSAAIPDVCPSGCAYALIQDAIEAAGDGDTITVGTGTYAESIVIDGVDVSLIADGDVLIQPTSCSIPKKGVIEIYNSVATVEGFTIDANWTGESGCLLGIYARGMPSEFSEGPVDVIVVNNNIYNYGKNGITVNGEEATAVIEGNTVTGRGPLSEGDYAQNGIQFGYGAHGTITGNTTTNHYWDGCSQPGKTGCTPWVATGVLLYDVEGNLEQNARIKADNTFADNQFDVLRVLIPGPYSEKFQGYR